MLLALRHSLILGMKGGGLDVWDVSKLAFIVLGIAGTTILLLRFRRGLPGGKPCFSSTFLWCISPCLGFTLAGVVRLLELSRGGGLRYIDNLDAQLQPIYYGVGVGVMLSALVMLLYSLLHHRINAKS